MNDISSAIKKHRLYSHFRSVQAELAKYGFVCWIAGGAVRDLWAGRELLDFDLVTDATYENILRIFPNSVRVGEAFAVAKLPIGPGIAFDLASFREESDYIDGRRPSHVVSSIPNLDAHRRDFTINSLFWDDSNQRIWDYTGGLEDLGKRVLKAVGDPLVRFNEDYLRILRLFRFSLLLDFKIDDSTFRAAVQLMPNIKKLSGERIWSELKKVENARKWNEARGHKMTQILLETLFDIASDESQQLRNLLTEDSLFLSLAASLKYKDFSSLLKSRFRVSNSELKQYTYYQLIFTSFEKLNMHEKLFELENSEELRAAYERASKYYSSELREAHSILEALNKAPQVLISRKELSTMVPVSEVAGTYREIRLAQWDNSLKSREEIVEYLGKKYAPTGEKP